MHTVRGPLIFLAILLYGCVMCDEFLRIELNDRLEQRYGNNSADILREMEQENTKQPTGKNVESSNHDAFNVIPTGPSERAFQKYYELRHKLKLRKLVNDEAQIVPVESTSAPTTTTIERETTPTTTKTIEEVTTTIPLCKKHELGREEEFAELITDSMSHDYDIIVFVDKEQLEEEPIQAPSGVGLFHSIVNFVRWLIMSQSAEVEAEDYENET